MVSPQRKLTDEELLELARVEDESLMATDSPAAPVSPSLIEAKPEPISETEATVRAAAEAEAVAHLTIEAQPVVEAVAQPEPQPTTPSKDQPKEQPKAEPKAAPVRRAKPAAKKAEEEVYFRLTLPETQQEWADLLVKGVLVLLGAWVISAVLPALVTMFTLGYLAYMVIDNWRKEHDEKPAPKPGRKPGTKSTAPTRSASRRRDIEED